MEAMPVEDRLPWMLAEARRTREFPEYARLRAQRRPWLSYAEAAFELDLTEGRVSQLVLDGTLRSFRGAGGIRVWAEDVHAYRGRRKIN